MSVNAIASEPEITVVGELSDAALEALAAILIANWQREQEATAEQSTERNRDENAV
jgi:hypothetical protein